MVEGPRTCAGLTFARTTSAPLRCAPLHHPPPLAATADGPPPRSWSFGEDRQSFRAQLRLVDIADPVVGDAIAPGETAAAVEHREALPGLEADLPILAGNGHQRGVGGASPDQRLRIMGRDHRAGERHVGDVGAIGVVGGIGPGRRTRQPEPPRRARARLGDRTRRGADSARILQESSLPCRSAPRRHCGGPPGRARAAGSPSRPACSRRA